MTRSLLFTSALGLILIAGCSTDTPSETEAGTPSAESTTDAAAADEPSDAAAEGEVLNVFATVRSDDGYLNLRDSPNADGDENVTGEIPNDGVILVTRCGPGAQGSRWCEVKRNLDTYSPISPEDNGFVYDAELEYLEPEYDEASIVGTGISGTVSPIAPIGTSETGFTQSEDGYVNLRAEPSSSAPVIRRVPNGAYVSVIGCAPGASDARWCLVDAVDDAEQANANGTRVAENLGYMYMAEVDMQ